MGVEMLEPSADIEKRQQQQQQQRERTWLLQC